MAKTAERPAPAATGWFAALRDPLRATCLLLIGVSLCVSFARLLEVPPLQSANDKSRWCTVWSLVEKGTYRIDEAIAKPGWDTIDKVLHAENDADEDDPGAKHFYSTKPPLMATLVAGLYWVEKKTLGWTLDEDLAATVRLLLVFINLLPWGAAVWMLSETVRRYASSSVTVVLITAIASFGTLLTPFLSTLNNHVPAAICLIFAVDAAMRITVDGDRRWWLFAWCGFCAALTVTFELPAAAFGVAIFGLLFWKDRTRTLTHFVPFAIVPLAAFFITNGLATGGLQPFYMFYGGDKYVYTHNGLPSYWSDPQGLDRAVDSPLVYLLHCTVGHHGILSLSPILLLSIVGWTIGLRKGAQLRDYLALGLGLTLLVLGYYLTRTSNYNYGGNTVALRWMLWLAPLWLLAMIPAIDRFVDVRFFRPVTALLLGVSVFSAWYPLGTPWAQPWLFTLMTRWKWIDYSDPPVAAAHAIHCWLYQLPTGPRQEDYWVELSSVDADGVMSVMRIEDGGRVLVNERDARIVRVLRRNGTGQSSELTLTIDTEAFNAGAEISRFLLFPQGDRGENYRRLIERFLTGLPGPAPFHVLQRIHRRSRVRNDYFECLEAVARVGQPSPDPQWEPRIFESRILVSPEVPFGILRMETYVYDASGRNQHAQRRWAIHRAGMFLPRPERAVVAR